MGDLTIDRVKQHLLSALECLGVKAQETSTSIGDEWVAEFLDDCKSRGMRAIDVSSRQLPYDVLVNGTFRVQCKKRKRRRGDRVVFRKHSGRYRPQDVHVFAVKYGDKKYLIPALRLTSRDGFIKDTVTLGHKAYRWLNNWNVFSDTSPGNQIEISQQDLQLNLFPSESSNGR
jgi:hypothetical protein